MLTEQFVLLNLQSSLAAIYLDRVEGCDRQLWAHSPRGGGVVWARVLRDDARRAGLGYQKAGLDTAARAGVQVRGRLRPDPFEVVTFRGSGASLCLEVL